MSEGSGTSTPIAYNNANGAQKTRRSSGTLQIPAAFTGGSSAPVPPASSAAASGEGRQSKTSSPYYESRRSLSPTEKSAVSVDREDALFREVPDFGEHLSHEKKVSRVCTRTMPRVSARVTQSLRKSFAAQVTEVQYAGALRGGPMPSTAEQRHRRRLQRAGPHRAGASPSQVFGFDDAVDAAGKSKAEKDQKNSTEAPPRREPHMLEGICPTACLATCGCIDPAAKKMPKRIYPDLAGGESTKEPGPDDVWMDLTALHQARDVEKDALAHELREIADTHHELRRHYGPMDSLEVLEGGDEHANLAERGARALRRWDMEDGTLDDGCSSMISAEAMMVLVQLAHRTRGWLNKQSKYVQGGFSDIFRNELPLKRYFTISRKKEELADGGHGPEGWVLDYYVDKDGSKRPSATDGNESGHESNRSSVLDYANHLLIVYEETKGGRLYGERVKQTRLELYAKDDKCARKWHKAFKIFRKAALMEKEARDRALAADRALGGTSAKAAAKRKSAAKATAKHGRSLGSFMGDVVDSSMTTFGQVMQATTGSVDHESPGDESPASGGESPAPARATGSRKEEK
eukprot:g5909.t1